MQKLHLIRRCVLIMFFSHLLDFPPWVSIGLEDRFWSLVFQIFHDNFGRSIETNLGTNTHIQVMILIRICQYCSAPLFPWLAFNLHVILELHQSVIEHVFNLLLMQAVNVVESFGTADRRNVENDSKMTGVSTIKFMDNSVPVNHDQLGPVFWVVLLQALE